MKILALTLQTFGTLAIAYAALSVHLRVSGEKRIDDAVLAEMKRERAIGITGVVMIIVGFAIELISLL